MEHGINESELLLKIAAGDESAFRDLFHRWRDKLYFFVLRITHSPEMAEDILQDVFVKIWTHRASLNTIQHFDAYLYKMSQNQAISGMKRAAKEALILSELTKAPEAEALVTDDAVLRRELSRKFQAILHKLPTQQRLVYTLTHLHGLKHEEVAQQLEISASTVKNHMTRALCTIRQELLQHYQMIIIYVFLTRVW
ncbi:RNA polymerase sigma-70 factor [Flavitalea sp. BT771]|uniref:RNA polymerase sigma factor n=1 Tax=Flavitalea sp. BT771 TaxID=3063329 RepID=UPI0026E21EDF|nr:RNA polymerase sigma-70 factor [Flavitalea sp. BT771]MDO6429053.1 RNA polymerase sigma-70 factor [Flavitalea sp. BT771]MDV6218819.1 RNA polymerase sigma-70 factor [Flavitalea sp. BT771]